MTAALVDHVSRALAVLPRCELERSERVGRLLRGVLRAVNAEPVALHCASLFRRECREVLIAEIHAAMEVDDYGDATHELLRVALVRAERAMGLMPHDVSHDKHPSEEWDEHHVRPLGSEFEECG
jgi:hypothetical protein